MRASRSCGHMKLIISKNLRQNIALQKQTVDMKPFSKNLKEVESKNQTYKQTKNVSKRYTQRNGG